MTDLFAGKYPQVQKVLALQDEIYDSMGRTPEPEAQAVQTRALQLIEQHVHRPQAEKEALLVAMTLASCPHFMIMGDMQRIAGSFSPEVQAIVSEMLADDDRGVLSKNMAQLKTALGVAMLELGHASLLASEDAVPRDMIAVYSQNMAREESLTFPNLDAPGLRAEYETAKSALLKLWDQKAEPPAAAPQRRKPGNRPPRP